jgi:hypothetical protein
MPRLILDYDKAHKFVEKNKSQGFFWDGWTIVKWSPSNNGYMEKNGLFRNNKWGYSARFELKGNGTWELNEKYDKFN